MGKGAKTQPRHEIIFGDNLACLRSFPTAFVDLIYVDPPFNTGKVQTRTSITVRRTSNSSGRIGFGDYRYESAVVGREAFGDAFDDFGAFLIPRLEEAFRVLAPEGSLFVHLDYREVHYCKIWLDQIFGPESFVNEIIWAYDFGGRSKRRWSSKHDTILWYAKNPSKYTFNYKAMDRIPYMAPGLVGPEKARKGKTPTDTWWHTIVPTNGHEKTGYPTQKPIGIIRRIVRIHSNPGDLLLDFFAGSGTLGVAAAAEKRNFILIDNNRRAINVMKKRLSSWKPTVITATPCRKDVDATSGEQTRNPVSDNDSAEDDIAQAVAAIELVSVLAITVSNYVHLKHLPGPKRDASIVRRLFTRDPNLALYSDRATFLHDPTVDELRGAIVQYVSSRTARGDVLIFYFSGHGMVMEAEREFGFCTVDSRRAPNSGSVLPLTVLNFRDVVRSLAMADVHPVFIVDACFSGAITGAMHDNLERHSGSARFMKKKLTIPREIEQDAFSKDWKAVSDTKMISRS